MTTILDALKYLIKMSLYLILKREEFEAFANCPTKCQLYSYILDLYQRIYDEFRHLPALKVHSDVDGVVYVEDVKIEKDYLQKVYTNAVSNYKKKHENLCELLGQSHGIDDTYSHFLDVNKPDYKNVGLVSEIKDNKFFEKSDREIVNIQVIKLIDEMTTLLFIVMYISSAITIYPRIFDHMC